ncbi:hypothetical protein KIPB_002758 [Kipferlia bialata]|uniref:ABM domain-containing protein n=1 Tax=Kipferlia bialata TaxID=797122 RepID=A0A9K3GG81_9EUKA|nr:hypothetical protein KIPB_002758 [Kipferlia bialata]|eukprot:g2758.t1
MLFPHLALAVLCKLVVPQAEHVKAELLKLIPITRAEEGCLQYDLHQDTTTPGTFLFYETWQNRDLWQKHMNNTHLAAYVKATEGCVDSFVVNEMTKI